MQAALNDPLFDELKPFDRLYIAQSNAGLGYQSMFQILDETGQLQFNCSMTIQPMLGHGYGGNTNHTRHVDPQVTYTVNDTSGRIILIGVAQRNNMTITSGANTSIGLIDGGFTGSNYTATSSIGLGTFQIQQSQAKEFNIFYNNTSQVGVMKRGLDENNFINAHNFGMSFPKDLDGHAKALLFAAGLLIYKEYFISTILGADGGTRGAQMKMLAIMGGICGGCTLLIIIIMIVIFVFVM